MNVTLPPALYIPTSSQPSPFYSTDDYVEQTDYVYHLQTDRLLTVGNPYFAVDDKDKEPDAVPKVSGNQYRVFRLRLPDPNTNFDVPDGVLDPERYRLVFRLVGLEVCRGQPLGVGACAAPMFNKGRDVENPSRLVADDPKREDDNRVDMGIDPKQNQMLVVGCAPALGQHWAAAAPCTGETLDTKCPPIELVTTVIEDGDMSDIGFGAMDFGSLGANAADVPLELVQAVSKYPDWIKMHTDPYGDSCFYIVRREQLYARRLLQHSGGIGESIPTVYGGASAYENNNNSAYVTIPSGSVVTSDSQLFNRPYWLSKAQGPNNGVCWHNNVFITVLDNTRNTIMNISIKADDANGGDIYKPKDFVAFVRHVEEFELMCLVRLCKVPLEPPVLAHIYRMSPSILEGWGISEFPQVLSGSEDKYRYLDSQATRCPLPAPPAPPAKRDPWGSLHFWDVDCTGRLSLELPLFPLGRKYLALPYVAPPVRPSRATARTKRPASASGTPVAGNTRAKRRRR